MFLLSKNIKSFTLFRIKGLVFYLIFSWIKVYFYHMTYLCIMIFNLTFQALDPNFMNQIQLVILTNLYQILIPDEKLSRLRAILCMYDTNFLLFPRISNFRKLFVQVDFSMYLSRYKVFVFQQLWCSIEKRSEGDGSNLVRKMVVLFVTNVGLFISCSFLSQSVSNGSSQQHHTVGKKCSAI